jgi:hypothetical protein
MTPPSRRADFSSTVASIRRASQGCRAGGRDSFIHFEAFVNHLFCLTIGHKTASIRLSRAKAGKKQHRVLSGGHDPGGELVVRLTNDHYLRFVVSLFLDSSGADAFLRTSLSLYQYQLDTAGDDWVFRYEYKREPEPGDARPVGHLHVCGRLSNPGVLSRKRTLERVHFPCGRPTVESVIRLLIDDFGVPSDAPEGIWRPLLAETERDFLRVSHKAVPPSA